MTLKNGRNGNTLVVHKGMDKNSLKRSFWENLTFSLSKDKYSATKRDYFQSLALTVRDRLVERWSRTQQAYYQTDAKRIYYLSLEFLIGRLLKNSLLNLGLEQAAEQALEEMGFDLEDLSEVEWDAGLGNGGLGRLAACYLDSMSTLGLPGYGYGILYEYGIFFQRIVNGYQVEAPDNWMRYGNPWMFPRPENLYPVKFYGRPEISRHPDGRPKFDWVEAEEVMAMAYDIPVPGYGNGTVNTLRLWAAKATREFDLNYFNSGDYVAAVENKNQSENLSRVLYPSDSFYHGRELRLKQQYFFVSATLQDALRRYKKVHETMDDFADKVFFQLNDTHPAIAIPEMMRLLMDQEGLEWDRAWEITTRIFGYTNHTVLPEALEHWSVSMVRHLLPRVMQIIEEINRRFMEEVKRKYPQDRSRWERMSIISQGDDPQVRMANLAIVGSCRVNGVAELHTRILKERIFSDFHDFYPDKIVNITNGISHRQWLMKCNPELAKLITKKIGYQWVDSLEELKRLESLASDRLFLEKWQMVKRSNKLRLAEYIKKHNGLDVSLYSMFDCQVKRFHEYKRQLLNILGVIAQYRQLKAGRANGWAPRTVIFAGKAAPSYQMAKLIIKLINSVAEVVNQDPEVGDLLKVVFLANYGVSLAEVIIPATDLSQQISTAGWEASGTGNMKFALNGALTLGTLDGANIEIREAVGQDNFFLFGLTADEVLSLQQRGYRPREFYEAQPELRAVIDDIAADRFSPKEPGIFRPLVDSLLNEDRFLVLADFAAYMEGLARVHAAYRSWEQWAKMSVVNVANMGRFSSDRSVREYNQKIWGLTPVPIENE